MRKVRKSQVATSRKIFKFFSRMNVKCSEIDMLVHSYSVGLIKLYRLVSQSDLFDTSSGPSNIKTTDEEGSSEPFPPLTTNAICHSTSSSAPLS